MKLIVATDLNFGIGRENDLPWSFAKDMQHFKNLTTQNPNTIVLMGRKTYESIPEKFKPLPARLNVVISTQNLASKGFIPLDEFNGNFSKAYFINHLSQIQEFISEHLDFDIYCIGGKSLYDFCFQQNFITEVFHTLINSEFKCDTFIQALPENLSLLSQKEIIDTNRNDNKDYQLIFKHFEVN